MRVPANETGVIRVFLVDLPADQIDTFRTPDDADNGETPQWPLRDALGASYLDEDFIEVFPVSDLDDLGLAGYLIEGHGVPPDQITPMRPQLNAIKGHVLLVFSQAFGDFAQNLSPKSPLRHIATFQEEPADITFQPLPSEAAKPGTGPGTGPKPKKRPVSDAAMSGRIATAVLLFMFIFIALMVWIGS